MLRSVRVTQVFSLKRFWVIPPPPPTPFGFRPKKENVEQLRYKPYRAYIGRFWRLATSGCERMRDMIDGKEVWIEHENLDKIPDPTCCRTMADAQSVSAERRIRGKRFPGGIAFQITILGSVHDHRCLVFRPLLHPPPAHKFARI